MAPCRSALIATLMTAGQVLANTSAVAEPKGAPIDVFGGAVSSRAPDKVIDMGSYCRATLDVVLTRSFSGTVSFDGNSGGNAWFKDAPELGQVVNVDGTVRGHTFIAHQPQGPTSPSWAQLESYTFTSVHRYLRIVLRSVNSGQSGGTIRATITPLPC